MILATLATVIVSALWVVSIYLWRRIVIRIREKRDIIEFKNYPSEVLFHMRYHGKKMELFWDVYLIWFSLLIAIPAIDESYFKIAATAYLASLFVILYRRYMGEIDKHVAMKQRGAENVQPRRPKSIGAIGWIMTVIGTAAFVYGMSASGETLQNKLGKDGDLGLLIIAGAFVYQGLGCLLGKVSSYWAFMATIGYLLVVSFIQRTEAVEKGTYTQVEAWIRFGVFLLLAFVGACYLFVYERYFDWRKNP